MRKLLFLATLMLGAVTVQAQEKVMNIQKTDQSSSQVRMADLQKISFLSVEEGNQGLLVKTLGGETAAVSFEMNPVVTVAEGKLIIQSKSEENLQFEISDIEEITFGTSGTSGISKLKGFECVLQDDGVMLRGIPKGVKPRVYTIDGRSVPTPPFLNDELRLSRSTLGSGIFIVKVGTFSTKIHF